MRRNRVLIYGVNYAEEKGDALSRQMLSLRTALGRLGWKANIDRIKYKNVLNHTLPRLEMSGFRLDDKCFKVLEMKRKEIAQS